MRPSPRNTKQAWIWATGVNLVVFVLLWIWLTQLPLPTEATPQPLDSTDTPVDDQGAGGAFGQMTHLVGDSPTAEDEGLNGGPEDESADSSPVPGEPAEWINEFYLDRGPVLSFSPRLNPDGSPRPHPTDLDWFKGPTYEDNDSIIDTENLKLPEMSPQTFSKLDLPEELRELNFHLTVHIRLDSRGRVQGIPQIIHGSGSRIVDQITISKIMTEVSFTPATRKDTGEPVSVLIPQPIFWE